MKIDVREFVEHVLRRASEKGGPSLADVTVDDILFLANCAGVRLRGPKVMAILKKLHSEGRISRCTCAVGNHWRYVPAEAFAVM